jgi:hypothetical protein
MLHAGLDLSRRRPDVWLLNDAGELVAHAAAAPDADGLRHLVGRVKAPRVRAVIESMNGARFVHDALEELGWEVLVADAQKVKGLAPLACKTDNIGAAGLHAEAAARGQRSAISLSQEWAPVATAVLRLGVLSALRRATELLLPALGRRLLVLCNTRVRLVDVPSHALDIAALDRPVRQRARSPLLMVGHRARSSARGGQDNTLPPVYPIGAPARSP